MQRRLGSFSSPGSGFYTMSTNTVGGFAEFGSSVSVNLINANVQLGYYYFGPYATAGFRDQVTVAGPSGSGYLEFIVDVTGSINATGNIPYTTDWLAADAGLNNILAYGFLMAEVRDDWTGLYRLTGPATVTVELPILFNTEVPLSYLEVLRR